MKGRMRQRQRDIAQGASVSAVPKADFVVMNPTHYAVALKYDEATMSAPQVISRGTDLVPCAFAIWPRATTFRCCSRPCWRAPVCHAELDQPIPATLYTAVAQVLAYVYRLKAALRGQGRMPGELVEPYVPPELDPLNKLSAQAKGESA
jgi:flagellar biosynthetic protein FlhB